MCHSRGEKYAMGGTKKNLLVCVKTMKCCYMRLDIVECILHFLGFTTRVVRINKHALIVHHDLRHNRCNVDIWTKQEFTTESDMQDFICDNKKLCWVRGLSFG